LKRLLLKKEPKRVFCHGLKTQHQGHPKRKLGEGKPRGVNTCRGHAGETTGERRGAQLGE